jgi:hypothetical protein
MRHLCAMSGDRMGEGMVPSTLVEQLVLTTAGAKFFNLSPKCSRQHIYAPMSEDRTGKGMDC